MTADGFELETFSGCLNETFRLHCGTPEPLEVELIEATRTDSQPERQRSFSVLFRGPRQPVLRQAIYPLEHPRLGSLELFLVPVGPDELGMRYEAVFSRV